MSAISPVLSSGLLLDGTGASAGSKDPAKIRDAASQFESLLIGQVFKTVHEDEEGWLGTGEDQAGSSALGLADEYLAQSISKHGGLGLAQMIERQLGSSGAGTVSADDAG